MSEVLRLSAKGWLSSFRSCPYLSTTFAVSSGFRLALSHSCAVAVAHAIRRPLFWLIDPSTANGGLSTEGAPKIRERILSGRFPHTLEAEDRVGHKAGEDVNMTGQQWLRVNIELEPT